MFFNGRFYARLNHVPLRNDGARSEREGCEVRERKEFRDSERRGEERFLRVNGDERNGREREQVFTVSGRIIDLNYPISKLC